MIDLKQNLIKGKIIVSRESGIYTAGFCLIKGDISLYEIYHNILHEDEDAFFHCQLVKPRKESYLLGRIAAKKAISNMRQIGSLKMISILSGVFNFPIVKGISNVNVSISHCSTVAVAIAFPEEHPMSIDIEKIDFANLSAIKEQLSKRELELIKISSLSTLIGCTMAWTIKECLSKVLRTGLTIDFQLLQIETFKNTGTCIISTFCHFPQYKTISYHTGDYICSIILPRLSNPELEVFGTSLKMLSRKLPLSPTTVERY